MRYYSIKKSIIIGPIYDERGRICAAGSVASRNLSACGNDAQLDLIYEFSRTWKSEKRIYRAVLLAEMRPGNGESTHLSRSQRRSALR
jgi:hypothetical protein